MAVNYQIVTTMESVQ